MGACAASALYKILALHLLKTYFTLKDTYTDGISTALERKHKLSFIIGGISTSWREN